MFIPLMISCGCYIVFPTVVFALEEKAEPCWCLKIQVLRSTLDPNGKNKFVRATIDRRKEVASNDDENSNKSTLTVIASNLQCTIRCKSITASRTVYQVIIVLTVFILSILSERLGGVQTGEGTGEVFKRKNKFVEEIEQIKRWGKSMKPFIVVEQDLKIDWSSDIWLGKNNDVETSSTVWIRYTKTQLKSVQDNNNKKFIAQ